MSKFGTPNLAAAMNAPTEIPEVTHRSIEGATKGGRYIVGPMGVTVDRNDADGVSQLAHTKQIEGIAHQAKYWQEKLTAEPRNPDGTFRDLIEVKKIERNIAQLNDEHDYAVMRSQMELQKEREARAAHSLYAAKMLGKV